MKKSKEMAPCEICGHVYGQNHRLLPGEWGGTYNPDNVAWLCPNHHAAIHLMMKWYSKGWSSRSTGHEAARLDAYMEDVDLFRFFIHEVKPIIAAAQEALRQGRDIVAAGRDMEASLADKRLAQCVEALRHELGEGPMRVADIRATLNGEGFSLKTVYKSKGILGLNEFELNDRKYWELPTPE